MCMELGLLKYTNWPIDHICPITFVTVYDDLM